MSYILDALKKAEADRDPEARASLAMATHERRRNRWLAYAVVVALIANAAILLWLFLPDEIPGNTEPAEAAGPAAAAPVAPDTAARSPAPGRTAAPASAPVAAPRTNTTAEPVIETPRPAAQPARQAPQTVATPAPAQQRQTMAPEAATGDTIIGPNATSPPAPGPVRVDDLPGSQRSRFPSLSFSTHIYADDADLRAIVVNGTRLEEGDRLGALSLHEITEDGAVFRFEGRLVSVSVLDEWN